MPNSPQNSSVTSQLLDKIRNGEATFDALFRRHRPALKAAVELRLDAGLRARVDASDVVQEAQAEAYRRLNDYLDREPMPFHVWLRKTAMERLIMLRRHHLNSRRRAADRELPLPNHSTVLLGKRLYDSVKTPSQIVSNDELCRRVAIAMAELPDVDREILLMRIYESLSYEEIGNVLDINPATARKRQGRALVKLHRIMTTQE